MKRLTTRFQPADPGRVPANAASAKVRMDRADELLAQMINDIGTGPAFARLRKDALRIKHVLRGLDW